MGPLLDVENLTVSYRVGKGWLAALRDFRLRLGPRQVVGLVGESGSGKSTAAMAMMRYLGRNGRVERGARLDFAGEDLLEKSAAEMRFLWAGRMKLVPQNAGAALNPSMRIGAQVREVLGAAGGLRGSAAEGEVLRMLRDVNLVDAEEVARRYAHELSGGMQQRVVIAMALISNPDLLILDEPTTGLDVTTEAVILELVRGLISERETSVVYITHNLGVVAQLCERVVVLYAGEIMEEGPVEELYRRPRHPYTLGLLNSAPRLGQNKRDGPLMSIDGNPPTLGAGSVGCSFAGRCAYVVEKCRVSRPPLENLGGGQWARCFRWEDVGAGRSFAAGVVGQAGGGHQDGEMVMRVSGLEKHFPVALGLGDWLRGRRPGPIRAVDGVDLSLRAGQTLGLVGESGSGKTTLSRVIIGLQERTGGELELLGMDVRGLARERSPELLSKLQMVFQNPQGALNPYMSVGQALRRPLIKLRGLSRGEAEEEVLSLLERVNLGPDYAGRYPEELSGGEKQRVVIARAFASNPEMILCDEPVSALDASVQSAVLNLLARLQAENGGAYLFISHDLAVVGYLADVIAVMYLGQLFEVGPAESLFRRPHHPYTEALVAAIPLPDPGRKSERALLGDTLPSAQDPPSGCRFHTRCPRKIGAVCEVEVPPWRHAGGGQAIRCHIPLGELMALQENGGG